MGRAITSLDLVLNPPPPGAILSRWVYGEIRSAILDGRLKRGMRLPASRELARRYRISRATVINAFDQLRAEGYLSAKVGAGTCVSAVLPEDLLNPRRVVDASKPARGASHGLSEYASRVTPVRDASLGAPRPFRLWTPALDAFPLSLWTKIASRRLRTATRMLLADANPYGYPPLREAVAAYLGSARGVKCTKEQVIIVAGIQQALDLTARLAIDPGDEVWLEDPCAFIVAGMLKALGAKIVAVPVDRDGLDVAEGRRLAPRAKLVYVTPAHQFPLGVSMSVLRRRALLEWAGRAPALIFEDDYDSEFRYSSRPLQALQGIDRFGSVVFAGSFSKVLFPSLRLGYMVVPDELVDTFAGGRLLLDRHSSVIDQAILCDFINEGHFGSHIRRMRELYAGRLQALGEAVRRKLEGALRLDDTEAGIHTIGWLCGGLPADDVAKAAAERKLEVLALRGMSLQTERPEGLLLGFAAVHENELRRGVDRLADAIESCASTRPRDHRSGRSKGRR